MYDRAADLIRLSAPGVPRAEIEALPGHRADALGTDLCYPEPAVLILASRHGLAVSRVARDAVETRARMIGMSTATEPAAATALGDVLRPYQSVVAVYACLLGHAIVGDEMGLGKTAEVINAIETAGHFPARIVCPASLRENWLAEIALWTPHRTAAISDGHVIPDADYVVMSYEASVIHSKTLTEMELAA